MRVYLIFLFLLISCPVKNYSGLTIQEQKEQRLKARIYELKGKYPPSDNRWMYKITKSLKE